MTLLLATKSRWYTEGTMSAECRLSKWDYIKFSVLISHRRPGKYLHNSIISIEISPTKILLWMVGCAGLKSDSDTVGF